MNIKDFVATKEEHMKNNIHPKLDKLNKALAKNFVAGELSIVDFLLHETFIWCMHVDANVFDNYPNIKEY